MFCTIFFLFKFLFSVSFLIEAMGCDGGTIPKRCELVREKKKPEKVDKEIELNAKWCHCAISQEELREPIVSCELGHLYRKEVVLEYLLDKSNASSDIARHIRSLKDVKQLVLTKKNEKAKSRGHAADSYLDFQASDYICPIAGIEMNGRYRFCFSWKCGCVFSERGLKEVPSSVCHNCGTTFGEEDIVVINGKEEDVEKLREKMQRRRQKAKEEKKAKKSKRAATVENGEDTSVKKKQKVDLSNGQTTAGTSTSVMESKIKGAKPKSSIATSTETSTKAKASSSSQGSDATLTYTKYKSVAENPDASKVFKSLFSSGNKDKPKKLQSNWVTYHSYHC